MLKEEKIIMNNESNEFSSDEMGNSSIISDGIEDIKQNFNTM